MFIVNVTLSPFASIAQALPDIGKSEIASRKEGNFDEISFDEYAKKVLSIHQKREHDDVEGNNSFTI